MKHGSIALLLLMGCLPVRGDEAADRRAVQKTIDALNNPDASPASVWAPGVDGAAERAKLTRGPLSETYGGPVNTSSILFPDAQTATILATQTHFTISLYSRSILLQIRMKKVQAGWRIVEIRMVQ